MNTTFTPELNETIEIAEVVATSTQKESYDALRYQELWFLAQDTTADPADCVGYVHEMAHQLALRIENAQARFAASRAHLQENKRRSQVDPNVFKGAKVVGDLQRITSHFPVLVSAINQRKMAGHLWRRIVADMDVHGILSESHMGPFSALDLVDLVEASYERVADRVKGMADLSERLANYGIVTPDEQGWLLRINKKDILLSAQTVHALLCDLKDETSFQRVPFDVECIMAPRTPNQAGFTYNGVTMVLKGRKVKDIAGKEHTIKGDFRLTVSSRVYDALFTSVAYTIDPKKYADLYKQNKANARTFGEATHLPANQMEFEYAQVMSYLTPDKQEQYERAFSPLGRCYGTLPEDWTSVEAFSKVYDQWYAINIADRSQLLEARKAYRPATVAAVQPAPQAITELTEHPF